MSRRLAVLLSSLALLSSCPFLAPVAHAKPWAKWAKAPLASDSSYLALSSRPSDSLTASQLMWVAVQRDWRAQRGDEALAARTRGDSGAYHPARGTDKRFAALASRPYAALADEEREWLVAENQLQRLERDGSSDSGVGGILVAAILGAIGGLLLVAYAVSKQLP